MKDYVKGTDSFLHLCHVNIYCTSSSTFYKIMNGTMLQIFCSALLLTIKPTLIILHYLSHFLNIQFLSTWEALFVSKSVKSHLRMIPFTSHPNTLFCKKEYLLPVSFMNLRIRQVPWGLLHFAHYQASPGGHDRTALHLQNRGYHSRSN